MAEICPVSFHKIDGNLARIGSFFVISILLLYLFSSSVIFLYILSIDFYIRIYGYKPYSLIFQSSKFIKKLLNIKTKMMDSGAKKLAAQFGLIFSIILILESHLHLDTALYITSAILLFCASLELLFDYCIGCKVYYIIKKIYPKFST